MTGSQFVASSNVKFVKGDEWWKWCYSRCILSVYKLLFAMSVACRINRLRSSVGLSTTLSHYPNGKFACGHEGLRGFRPVLVIFSARGIAFKKPAQRPKTWNFGASRAIMENLTRASKPDFMGFLMWQSQVMSKATMVLSSTTRMSFFSIFNSP